MCLGLCPVAGSLCQQCGVTRLVYVRGCRCFFSVGPFPSRGGSQNAVTATPPGVAPCGRWGMGRTGLRSRAPSALPSLSHFVVELSVDQAGWLSSPHPPPACLPLSLPPSLSSSLFLSLCLPLLSVGLSLALYPPLSTETTSPLVNVLKKKKKFKLFILE